MSTDSVNALWRVGKWFSHLSPDILEKLKSYHGELIRYNAKLNLIGRQTERDADEQHFADCISACELILKNLVAEGVTEIYDLGSGNGLPGVVLAILAEKNFPSLRIKLVDSDERKVEFLKQITFYLKLSNCEVINERLESLKLKMPSAITRGFASISKVALMAKDLFDPNGIIYHMKGSNWVREVGEMPSQLCAFWAPQLLGEYTLPLSQARRAVVSTKKLK